MFRERGGFSTRGGKYVLFKTLYEDKFLAQDWGQSDAHD